MVAYPQKSDGNSGNFVGFINKTIEIEVIKVMSSVFEFEEVEEILTGSAAEMMAAEAHGVLSGMLCVSDKAECNNWLKAVYDDEVGELLSRDALLLLERFFDEAAEMIKSDDFEFPLFLPDDDEPLGSRASALAEWCRGFIYGLGYGGMDKEAEWQGESREVLQDMVEISRLDSDCGGEVDENAFVELSEFVRIGVLVIFAELRDSGEGGHNETVH
ncbi:MAG: hypothetical protein DRQ61_09460 [Gammaproteobacteria bacterium]|nr:MAG: hypothetical protein DRQ61_09460 [Gammaproteobacteria bacterium]